LPANLDKQVFLDWRRRASSATSSPTATERAGVVKQMCKLMKDIPDDVIGNRA
jgi:hypothetical protein